MSAQPYRTLAGPHRHDALIQQSEFLAFADRADTPEDAHAWVQRLRQQRPDATHVCWAYQIGPAYRFHDDGEPGGTAGAPMLRAIQGQGLDHVVVAVVRYYGGVKLGTGGLARAYGGTAAECLRTAPQLEVRPRLPVTLEVPFDQVSAAYHLLGQLDAVRGEEQYGPAGLRMALQLEPEQIAPFRKALQDATRGQAQLLEGTPPPPG
ncbi:YigZ family protein [Deinococcus sonorensis]|uniref:YigZ family protein n=2 Tax=Deinococcus sonorensis TaxID=309891 RepID=A0AAU7UEP9_9DEIO